MRIPFLHLLPSSSTLAAIVAVGVFSVGCASAPAAYSKDGGGSANVYGDAEASTGYAADEAMPMMATASMEAAPSSPFGGLFAEDRMASPVAMAPPPPPPPPKAAPLPTGETTTTTTGDSDKGTIAEAAKRLVIYTGSISLLVPQVEPAIATFVAEITAAGGYLQNQSSQTVTMRIPAASFFATIDKLKKTGKVTDEQVNATDVTKQVFDLELRLQTADESRKRLLKLLENATKMEDILAIETQVRRLTEEIELMKGQLRNLGDQVAFSTLTVTFYANAPAPNPYPQRTRSRFEWINHVGIENVLGNF
ncbi:MAG TPA: DUF4349 domain-containing protein [Myxococcota bacterium]